MKYETLPKRNFAAHNIPNKSNAPKINNVAEGVAA